MGVLDAQDNAAIRDQDIAPWLRSAEFAAIVQNAANVSLANDSAATATSPAGGQQSIIRAVKRVLADMKLVPNGDGTYHFQSA